MAEAVLRRVELFCQAISSVVLEYELFSEALAAKVAACTPVAQQVIFLRASLRCSLGASDALLVLTGLGPFASAPPS